MENLRHLIKCLKPSEVQFIKSFYQTKFNGCCNKRLQLFKLILADKIQDNQQAAKLLYAQESDSALCHLKKRLEEDILNFMLVLPANEEDSEIATEELQCRKLQLQGKILISRGLHEEGISLLKKTSILADKYEFPDIKLSSDDTLRSYQNSVDGLRTLNQYNTLISNSFDTLKKILNAKKLNHNLMAASKSERSRHNYEKEAQVSLNQLKNENTKKGSKNAVFLYKMTLLESNIQKKDFDTAKEFAQELLELLDHEPSLHSTARCAEINLKLAEINVHLRDYEHALEPAHSALSLTSRYHLLCPLQVMFFIYFRNQNYAEAEHICNRALNHPQINKYLKGRWNLLQAALNFSQRNYQLTNQTLRWATPLNTQESLWPLGQKLLEMLNTLELQDYDWFEFKFETFRKKASQFKSETTERVKLICWLFRALMKNNFNYKALLQQENDRLRLLKGDQAALYWNPMGWELINIYDWMIFKAQHT